MTAEIKKPKKTTTKIVKPAVKKVVKKKAVEKKPEIEEKEKIEVVEEKTPEEKKSGYLYAIGRRKEAIATVKLHKNGKGKITVNGKVYTEYFPTGDMEQIVSGPLKSVGQADKVDIEAKSYGGGLRGQSEAVRLGISRALVLLNINFKKNLRKAGYLTRDPRVKERKKPGLKKARRAPQWQKR
ncbi:30S ribosomal protein S9 [Patescibacteria group bacterium]|nr:30S ribosomal protein S9 [Patescibacteria group bacterium]